MGEDYNLKLIIEAQDKFSAELKNMQGQIEQIQVTAKKSSQVANDTISSIKKGIAGLGLGALIVSTTKSMITLADNLEKSKIAFTTMLGSGEKAEAMLKDLSQFAQKTPFELTGIRSSAQQLLAMGVQAKDMIPTLKSLGDVSAGLSVPLERLALNYGQVIAQGKLTGKELRDFTTAGVPLLDELASMLGKSTTAIQDMISKGQISSDIMVQAFQNMTSEGGKFANLMDQQATTLTGLWSNFEDSLASLGEEIGSELLPALKDYMQQLGEWLDNNIESIKKVASEVVETAKVIADNVISLIGTIGDTVSDFVSFINDIVGQVTDIVAGGMTDADDVTAQGLTGMEGNWHDFFYYVQQGITTIVGSLKTALNVADSLAKTVGKKSWREGLYQAGNVNIYKRDEQGYLIYNKEKLDYEKKSIIEQLKESYQGMKEYVIEGTKDVQNAWNDGLDDMYNQLEQNYINQVEKLRGGTYKANKTFSDSVKEFVSDVNSNLNDLGGGDSGSSKISEKEKKYQEQLKKELIGMQKAHKEYVKQKEKDQADYYKKVDSESREMLKRQGEVLTDLVKEYQDKFDDIQDKIKDTQKEIKKLSDDIEKLTKDENSSLASEFLNAKNILKDMEREFEGISSIANGISRDELNDAIDTDFIGGYAVSNIKKVKEALEEVSGIYDGLSEEQQKQLSDEIARQEEYNKLNKVDQIKYDYKIKKDEAQKEYEDKKKYLEDLQDQQAKLQEEYLGNIQDARDTYDRMYEDILKFEKDYQILFDNDMFKQQKAVRDLKDLWKDVADARSKAIAYGTDIEGRASGGYVAGGTPYLVGENGPELFVPKTNGTIVPNNEITNNNGIEINISGVSVRNDNDIQTITDEIIRKIKLEKTFGIA